MTNSFTDLQHPVDPATASLLGRLAVTANGQGVELLLVGAFAREVLFYHMHGIETGIRTMDTDISVRVSDWDAFHRLRKALDGAGFVLKDDLVEKIVDEASGKEVDLIPFGPITGGETRLIWPDNGPTWNVLGFEEALASSLCLTLPLTDGAPASIPVVTIASLVMLKIVSFYDRPKDRARDVRDIGFVVQHYLDAGNRERLLTQPELVSRAAHDPHEAAAVLLGQDMRAIAGMDTRNFLVDRLRRETTSSSACPLAHVLAGKTCKGNFRVARTWLQSMLEGLGGRP